MISFLSSAPPGIIALAMFLCSAPSALAQLPTVAEIEAARWIQPKKDKEGNLVSASHAGQGQAQSSRIWMSLDMERPKKLRAEEWPWPPPGLPVQRIVVVMDMICDPRLDGVSVGEFKRLGVVVLGVDGKELQRETFPPRSTWSADYDNPIDDYKRIREVCGDDYAIGKRQLDQQSAAASARDRAIKDSIGEKLRADLAREEEEKTRVRTDPGPNRRRCTLADAKTQDQRKFSMGGLSDFMPLYIDSCGSVEGRPAVIWSIKIRRAGAYDLYVRASFDGYLRLFDSRGRLLAENDNHSGRDPLVRVQLDTLTYYLEISSVSQLRETGQYRVAYSVGTTATAPRSSARAFWFILNNDARAGRRDWSTTDGKVWVERYPSGARTVFEAVRRESISGASGTVVRPISTSAPGVVVGGADSTEIFIPDAGSRRGIYIRSAGPVWSQFAEISVENSTGVQPPPSAQTSRLRSTESRIPTSIEFVNRGPLSVHVDWIDPSGSRVRYKTLAAGQSYEQPTYVTHPWEVTTTTGRVIGVYLPRSTRGQVVIDTPR